MDLPCFTLTFMKSWFCCQPLPVPAHHGKRFSLRCFSKSTHISSENLSLSLTHTALISHSSAVKWVLISIKMNIRIYGVQGKYCQGQGGGNAALFPPPILSCLLFREAESQCGNPNCCFGGIAHCGPGQVINT